MSRNRIEWIKGYDPEIEEQRQKYVDWFWQTEDPDERRQAMRGVASLTALRSATFTSAYERALGMEID